MADTTYKVIVDLSMKGDLGAQVASSLAPVSALGANLTRVSKASATAGDKVSRDLARAAAAAQKADARAAAAAQKADARAANAAKKADARAARDAERTKKADARKAAAAQKADARAAAAAKKAEARAATAAQKAEARAAKDVQRAQKKAQAIARANSKAAGRKFDAGLGTAVDFGQRMATGLAGAAAQIADIGIGLAKIGAIAIGAGITYGIVKLNNELEKTQIGLAAIFGASKLSDGMATGMKMASGAIADMRRDAAELPGEFKDLKNIFSMAAVPGLQEGGMSINELKKFSSQAMAVSAALQVPMDQAARELAMLMEGRAGSHNVLGLKLAGLGGAKAKTFNALTPEKRIEFLQKKFKPFGEAIEVYKHSFDGLFSTAVDNAKLLGTEVTRLPFERVKASLEKINAWFDTHKQKLMDIATIVGEKLIHGWDAIEDRIKRLAPHIEHLGEKLAGLDIGKTLKTGALTLGAMKAAPLLVNTVMGAGELGGMAAKGASMFGGGAAAVGGTEAMAGAGAMAGTAAPVALLASAAALAVLVAVAVDTAAAMHVLSDETSVFHTFALNSWKDTVSSSREALTSIGHSFEILKPIIMTLVDVVGTSFIVQLQLVANFAVLATDAVEGFVIALKAVAEKLHIGRMFGTASPDKVQGQNVLTLKRDDKRGGLPGPDDHRAKAGAGGGGGGTTVQKVEIVVNQNGNPSQVARMTAVELENLHKHPRVARTPNFSLARP